jgi:hypothetical protein
MRCHEAVDEALPAQLRRDPAKTRNEQLAVDVVVEDRTSRDSTIGDVVNA